MTSTMSHKPAETISVDNFAELSKEMAKNQLNETLETGSTSQSGGFISDDEPHPSTKNGTVSSIVSSLKTEEIPEEETSEDGKNKNDTHIKQVIEGVYQFVGEVGTGARSIVAEHSLARPSTLKTTTTIHEETPVTPTRRRLSRLSFRRSARKSSNDNDDDDDQSVATTVTSSVKTAYKWQPFEAPGAGDTRGWISYFEVTITPAQPMEQESKETEETVVPEESAAETKPEEDDDKVEKTPEDDDDKFHEECVSVGLSLEGFDASCSMPGWTKNSYGYHGDDGHAFYQGKKETNSDQDAYGPTFGANNVIGCGINWEARRVFYTKNGHFLGYHGEAWKETNNKPLKWYPTVGLDSHVCVQINTKEPFVFDVASMVDKVNNEEELVVSEDVPVVMDVAPVVLEKDLELSETAKPSSLLAKMATAVVATSAAVAVAAVVMGRK